MRIGAHIHTGGGLGGAALYAADTGCECVQVFAKSPQTWRAPYRSEEDLALFRSELVRLGIGPVFTHASYLINLGSTDPDLRTKSMVALADELVRAAGFGAAGVVVHMGTCFGPDANENAEKVATAVAGAWSSAAREAEVPAVLLENAAGAGRAYGSRLPELCEAYEATRSTGVDVGICIDTCHAFAAGWDLRTAAGWRAVCDPLEECGALGGVRLIHANDCKAGLGEHRDRHEWVGDGAIGYEGFAAMFGEGRLADVPVVVEMPGDRPVKDIENVGRLRRLRDGGEAGACPTQGDA